MYEAVFELATNPVGMYIWLTPAELSEVIFEMLSLPSVGLRYIGLWID